MRIKVYPDQSGENQFIHNLRRQLACLEGARVEGIPLNHGRLLLRLPFELVHRADYTVVNWLENNICSSRGKLSVLGCLKFLGLILLFRVTCRRLIYIRHNLYPHRLKSRYSAIATAFVDRVSSFFCEQVALSEHMVGRGFKYVPHPLYELPQVSEFNGESQPLGSLQTGYFVIFGTISRYKNIHRIVASWKGKRRLLVIGKVADVDYLNELKALSKGRYVTIRGEMLSDAEASHIITGSLGVILSHDSEEMIVSGAFFYSVALGVRTYAIKNAFYERLMLDQPFPGLTLFEDADDLIERVLYQPVQCSSPVEEPIRRQGLYRFGDEAGIASWKKVLLN